MTEKTEIVKKQPLATSINDKVVWYDTISSHTATHIKDTPGLIELAKEVTQHTKLVSDFQMFHTDMGHIVGNSDLVETVAGDKLLYAKRLNRDNYSVFNLSKSPQPSSLVTTAFELQENGTYALVSTWVGPSDSPSFPGTERETPDSKEFWAKHALAWGNQEVQPGTETEICPW